MLLIRHEMRKEKTRYLRGLEQLIKRGALEGGEGLGEI